ncbi:hypothetical protein JNW91_12725, partial [Micromonospora sp. STR1_7]
TGEQPDATSSPADADGVAPADDVDPVATPVGVTGRTDATSSTADADGAAPAEDGTSRNGAVVRSESA